MSLTRTNNQTKQTSNKTEKKTWGGGEGDGECVEGLLALREWPRHTQCHLKHRAKHPPPKSPQSKKSKQNNHNPFSLVFGAVECAEKSGHARLLCGFRD